MSERAGRARGLCTPRRAARLSAACLALLLCSARVGAEGATPPPAPAPAPANAPASAYMGLGAAAERLKAKFSYDPLTGLGILERPGFRVSFAAGVAWLLVDWDTAIPVEAPRQGADGLVFSPAAFAAIEKAFRDDELLRRGHFEIAAILIDPGHGGKDPGAVGEHMVDGKRLRIVEKDLALDLSQRLNRALRVRFPDKRILVTREADSYPTLEERVAMANSVELAPNEAIIYVSIHANASFNKNARGFEVWYLNPEYRRTLVDLSSPGGPNGEIAPILNAMLEEEFTTESIILARSITAGIQAGVGSESPNRGVRAEEWFVVRNARMPSVLVEAGFVTNPEEARLLARDDYLKRLADGMYNGIVEFVRYFESMRGAAPP